MELWETWTLQGVFDLWYYKHGSVPQGYRGLHLLADPTASQSLQELMTSMLSSVEDSPSRLISLLGGGRRGADDNERHFVTLRLTLAETTQIAYTDPKLCEIKVTPHDLQEMSRCLADLTEHGGDFGKSFGDVRIQFW